MTNYNILNQDISFPIQSVLPLGKSGDGYNQFRAPSKWAYVDGNILALSYAVIVAPIADRAIRVYKYFLETTGTVAGAATYAQVALGLLPAPQPIMTHRGLPPYAAIVAQGFWPMDFAPVGISVQNNKGLYVINQGGAQIGFSIMVMYSTESWGMAVMTDGSDVY